MENPGVPNFEEELRKASKAAQDVEVVEKVPAKFSKAKAIETAKKVSTDVAEQSKKIVAEAVKASKNGVPTVVELWKKTVASLKKFFSGKNTKFIYIAAGGALVLALAITAFVRLEVVTVTKGMPLTSGDSTGTSVMIDKFASVERGDVIIGVMPGTKREDKKTILGSIFSQNDQTYAIFDGEVIWQLPLKDLVGKALFVEAKTKL
jgi:hypothetical protein